MSTRLRLTGLAILIPGIILGLIIAGQATPAMAEPPDEVKDFGLSLNLEKVLPPPEQSNTRAVSIRDIGNNPPPPQQANTRAATVRQSIPSAPRPSETFDCNAHLGWDYTNGYKYDTADRVNRDVGAYFFVGRYHNTNEPICVRRFHTPGSKTVLCSQAVSQGHTWQGAGFRQDVNSNPADVDFTGSYTFSGQAICSTKEGIQSDQKYIKEQQLKQFCARSENTNHALCT